MERIAELVTMQHWADEKRAAGRRIALVPTMGALHEGHLALVERAADLADRIVVSIFVNPIQFDRRDDFEGYPRDLEQDASRLAAAGVAVLFAPEAADMYRNGFHTQVEVAGVTTGLCGARRPGHFRGVTTVVTKLFHLVRPHVAVFGEKDYQQLVTIRRLVADLDFGIEIIGVPTVREWDGLALSSRNERLSPAGRAAARCIPRGLRAAMDCAAAGERTQAALLAAVRREIEGDPHVRLEYAELCDPETLEPVAMVEGTARLVVAAWVGDVRLIDNCAITAPAVPAGVRNGQSTEAPMPEGAGMNERWPQTREQEVVGQTGVTAGGSSP